MSLLLVLPNDLSNRLKAEIHALSPDIDIDQWPGVAKPGRVTFAVAWKHPKRVFDSFPNLNVISSFGAGTDHLLRDESIPQRIKLARIVSGALTDEMEDYVLMSVLNLLRKTPDYFHQKQNATWNVQQAYSKNDLTIGVMGLGELGLAVSKRLVVNGFRVAGWSKSKKVVENTDTFGHDELTDFLKRTNILVNLLPLTPETDEILDLDLFKQLKQPAFIINAARGSHLVDEDLIYALDTGLISHAVLDVFPEEPLPESHPFWARKQITITPHIAAKTDLKEAASLIVENYKRMISGLDLLYTVDRESGY